MQRERSTDNEADRRREGEFRRNNRTEEILGETVRTHAGYFVKVRRINFPDGGGRVRIELYQGDQWVRHIDMTTELAKGLAEILNGGCLDK